MSNENLKKDVVIHPTFGSKEEKSEEERIREIIDKHSVATFTGNMMTDSLMTRAAKAIYKEIIDDPGNKDKVKAWDRFMKMKENGFEDDEAERLRTLAKKMILYDNFLK